MSVSMFLADLRRRDIEVWSDGEQLRCDARAGALTAELRAELGHRKGEILEFLRAAQALASQQRAIVPLQPNGNRIPIFAVAGHNGDVFAYRALARALGGEQPFHGLEPPGLDGQSEPLVRIEDLAAYFAKQILVFRASGPCIVAGYCAGSAIAFELARQLQHGGVSVSFLALFGAPYPRFFRQPWQLKWWLLRKLERIGGHARELAARSWPERRRYIVENLARAEKQDAADGDPVLELRARVEAATLAAVRRYQPRPFAGCVRLFLPSEPWAHAGWSALAWRRVARQADVYFGPDGATADDMLREHADEFAQLLGRCCQDADLQSVSPVGDVRPQCAEGTTPKMVSFAR